MPEEVLSEILLEASNRMYFTARAGAGRGVVREHQTGRGCEVTTEAEVDYSMMEAGRELDALVAARVMGLTVEPRGGEPRYYNETMREQYGGAWTSPVPHYSTDLLAAWEVLDMMRGRGFGVVVSDAGATVPWAVDFDDGKVGVNVQSASLPVAICNAALFAVARSSPSDEEAKQATAPAAVPEQGQEEAREPPEAELPSA